MTAAVILHDPDLGWYQEGYLDLPPDLPFDAWSEVGRNLHRWERNVGFWLGDWWRYGEHRYGQSASQAAPSGKKAKTCMNAAKVAERIEPSRRRDDLTFSHHEAVARREPAEQDRLLAEAADKGWPVERLRSEVRHMRLVDNPGPDPDAYTWQWVCATCNDDGPHFDCPRPGETSFDRGAVCQWLADHRRHDVRFLGQEQIAERSRVAG